MSISIELKGREELEAHFGEIETGTPIAMRKAINAAALMVKASAVKLVKTKSPGKTETRYDPKRKHVVSRGGDAPNTDRGNLIRNIIVSSGVSIATKKYEALVRSQAPYSKSLEFGTKDMKKRPFMKPALDKNRKKIFAMVKQALEGAL